MARVIPIDAYNSFRLPGPRDRIAIIGPTGSGKTVAALWHLSLSNFNTKPWIVIDPKIDENIASIEGLEEIGVNDEKLPRHPGIYVVHPIPSQLDELDDMLLRVWQQENIGVYCDEGYMNAKGAGFLACVTQGRSKRVPMIILAQRPVFISRFVFSESQFFQMFNLEDDRDMDTIRSFVKGIPQDPLPQYYSWYRDVIKRKTYRMKPVPESSVSVDTISDRLDARGPVRRYI
jgi:hypothetical protein